MLDYIKQLPKKKRVAYIATAVFVVVCLLVELIGSIPGIPFNGWPDVFRMVGLSQGYVVPEGELEIHFLDVGNADCILIRQGEHHMLIDAGDASDYKYVVDYLDRHGVTKLDLVMSSHSHADHIGDMATILETYAVDRYLMAFMPEGEEPTTNLYLSVLEVLDERNIPVDDVNPGDVYTLGTAQVQILAPLTDHSDPNNMSVVARLTFGNRSFLFTGDAEAEVEREILTEGFDVSADVVKAGHHGSNTSSSAAFIRAVAPEYVVFTCGANNSYGHPHEEVVDRWMDTNAVCYRSDVHGYIVFTTDGESLTVSTEKGG